MPSPQSNIGRIVTLVVVDGTGTILGATDPVVIEVPWWQEVGPLVDAVPGITILRLLSVDTSRQSGGPVTYLVEATEEALATLSLQPWNGTLEPDQRRHSWAEPGGPAADLTWVENQVTVTGTPRQHRTWNLSAIWSVPIEDSGGEPDTAWLKCVPSFFAHEAAVLQTLGSLPETSQAIPRLLATERHRLLLANMAGEDGYEASITEQMEMIDTLVDLQLTAAWSVETLLRHGVPDHRSAVLAADLAALVKRLAPDRPKLQQLVSELPARLAMAGNCGVPDTLVHGDAHCGNCRRGVEPAIWFDWGDSFVGNPLLDVASHRMAGEVGSHWIDRWADAVHRDGVQSPVASHVDVQRAVEVLQPVATLRMAFVFQQFLDNIEPSEWVYHQSDVWEMLDKAEGQV